MPETTLIIIIILHFIGDFLLQNDKMALNKSNSFKWLSIHSIVYSLPFLLFTYNLYLTLLLILSHFVIDGISSRITKYLWNKRMRHEFFVIIGFDQLIHYIVLITLFKVWFY